MRFPLPVASYNLPSRVPSRLVNVYASQTVGKAPVELVSAPGVVSWCAPGTGAGRGLFVQRGVLYAVSGETLYSVNAVGTATSLGTVPGPSHLTFAGNDAGEVMTSNGYLWDGSSVAAIADTDLPTLSVVDSVDGYVVGLEQGTGRFVGSDLRDASSWGALSYATAEGSPDDLVSLIVDHRDVILIGQQSIEIYWNSGASGFPFERQAGGYIELGGLARHGVAKADNSVYWLASDRTIRRLNGRTPVRVSHHGVEEALSSYATVEDCLAFSWTWNGHILVAFRFPAEGACWVLDATTGEWHERQTYGESDWLTSAAVTRYGKTLVQHATTGAIGYLSDTSYTEFGGILRREWTYPAVYDGNRRLFHGELEIVLRTGDAPIGTTAYVMLEYSDDGGNTWVAMPQKALGNVGEYAQRVRWHRLGSSRDRVYRASVSAAVPVHVLDTQLQVS